MAKNRTTDDEADLAFLSNLDYAKTSQPKARPGAVWNPRGFYEVQLDAIEPNPKQVRDKGNFNEKEIESLAQTILDHGLRNPISLRRHPVHEDKYIIEQGERRYRAYRILEKRAKIKAIPATFEEDGEISESEKLIRGFIENDQREQLDHKSTLNFVHSLLGEMKAADIARKIGKSRAWVSMHAKLIDLENWPLREALEEKRIESVNVAYDLANMWKKDEEVKEAIARLLKAGEKITAGDVVRLKEKHRAQDAEMAADNEQENGGIPYTARQDDDEDEKVGRNDDNNEGADEDRRHDDYLDEDDAREPAEPAPRPAKAITFGLYKDEEVVLLTNKVPSVKTKIAIKTADGQEKEVPVKSVTLLRNWTE